MSGPIQQAGATVEPSEYSALATDEQFTGLWTQRSPLRDAAVPYVYRKFYSASRFDSIIDGINREITADLTDKRRPGSPVFNSSTFNGAGSYYSWKYIQNSQEVIRLIMDSQNGHIYDFTPATVGGTGKVDLFTKALPHHFGQDTRAAFCGVNTQLFYGDGLDSLKWTTGSSLWGATTQFDPGTLISTGANVGSDLYMALGGITMKIIASACDGAIFTLWVDPTLVPLQFPNLQGVLGTFSGLTAGAALNGQLIGIVPVSTTLGIFQVTFASGAYTATADTGACTTGNGISGATTPGFTGVRFQVIQDAGQQWKGYGTQRMNFGLVPEKTPLSPFGGITPVVRAWFPNTGFAADYAIMDPALNVQLVGNGPAQGGPTYPTWASKAGTPQTFVTTQDNGVQWQNWGQVGSWTPSLNFGIPGAGGFYDTTWVILDSNGNWQLATTPGMSDVTVPAWATNIGDPTTDNTITWTCLGPGTILTTADIQYSFSLHSIDGTVSTAAPVYVIQGPIVGPALTQFSAIQLFALGGNFVDDEQVDQIWIWRTAQGQATLVLEDQIPIDGWVGGGGFNYSELGVADTSINGNGALIPQIPAPTAKTANPPPAGFLPICYHLGRLWGLYKNMILYSAGPDAVTGNGNTQFPPLNFIAFTEIPILCFSSTTTQGPTLMVWTTTGIKAVYGDGTGGSPFTEGSSYMARTGLANRFAVDFVGSTAYAMMSTGKLCSYDPSGGYQEIGFPIGDQFNNVTTGAGSAATGALYNPKSTYVTWHERSSGDTGLFVADGAVGWFRYSPISPPESGGLWSPRAAIIGGTSAVQSIETSPGIFTLLIGPPFSSPGPILMRDQTGTVFGDGAGVSPYPGWDAKGSIGLCETGEIAEIAHIALKSRALGARPAVSLLIDELAAGVTVGDETTTWDLLELAEHHEDPPNLEPSITMFSDRYSALQGGGGSGPVPQGPKCDNFQLKIDYGSQTVGDELLKFAIFGAVRKERLQQ